MLGRRGCELHTIPTQPSSSRADTRGLDDDIRRKPCPCEMSDLATHIIDGNALHGHRDARITSSKAGRHGDREPSFRCGRAVTKTRSSVMESSVSLFTSMPCADLRSLQCRPGQQQRQALVTGLSSTEIEATTSTCVPASAMAIRTQVAIARRTHSWLSCAAMNDGVGRAMAAVGRVYSLTLRASGRESRFAERGQVGHAIDDIRGRSA